MQLLLAVVSDWFWRRYLSWRVVVVVLLGIFMAVQIAPVGFKMCTMITGAVFCKRQIILELHTKPGDLIVGSGELAFELGFEGRVLDDCRLGFLSGKRPDYIVMEGHYRDFWLPMLARDEPATYRYMLDQFYNKYEIVYDQSYDHYTVYGFSDQPYQVLKRRPIPLH